MRSLELGETAWKRRVLWAGVAVLSIVSPACTRIDNALAAVPIFAFMRDAPSFDPYEHPLPAPPGSVPFESPNGGELLPPILNELGALEAFAASRHGQNPLRADDPAALALGKVMFERHCAVCHGLEGRGDGSIVGAGKFPPVPQLRVGNAVTVSDGYLYAIIRAGRGLMPAYGTRVTHVERWAIVNYVRELQRAQSGAQPAAGQQAAPGTQQPAGPTQPAATPATTTSGQ